MIYESTGLSLPQLMQISLNFFRMILHSGVRYPRKIRELLNSTHITIHIIAPKLHSTREAVLQHRTPFFSTQQKLSHHHYPAFTYQQKIVRIALYLLGKSFT